MTIIGPAEIQILANGAGFAASLQRQIDPGINRMNRTVADATRTATRDFDRLADSVGDALDDINVDDLQIPVDLIGEEQIEDLADLVRQISTQQITIDAVGRPAADQVRDIARQLQAIDDVVVVITGDNDDARAELSEVIGLAAQVDRLQPTIDFAVNDAAIRAARGLVDDLDRRVEIEVDADTSQAERELGQLSGRLDFSNIGTQLSDSVTQALTGLGRVGGPIAAAGAGLGALFTTSFAKGIEFEVINDRLAAQLDLNTREAALAGEIAGDVYAGAWGESLEEVTGAVRGVIDQVGELNEQSAPEIERLTALSLDLAATFDQDVNEVLRASTAILRNDLAPSGEAALDVLATGFTRAGTRGDDLLETFAEYSNQLADTGINAEQFTGLLVAGLDAGARSTDGVADAVKELNLRITEGTDGANAKLQELGLNLVDIQDLLDSGRGFEAIQLISERLGEVTSRSEQLAIAQELLGGTYEQVGIEAVLSFARAEEAIDGVDGTAPRLSDNLNDNARVSITAFRREWEQEIAQFGQALAETLETGDQRPLERAGRSLGERAGENFVDGMQAEIGPNTVRAIAGGLASALIPEVEVAGRDVGGGLAEGIRLALFDEEFGIGQLFAGGNTGDPITVEVQGVVSGLDVPTAEELAGRTDFGALNRAASSAGAALDDLINRPDFGKLNLGASLAADGIADLGEEAEAGATGPITAFANAVGVAADSIEEFGDAVDLLFNFSGEIALAQAAETVEELADAFTGVGPEAVDAAGNIDLATEAGRSLLSELTGVSGAVADLFRAEDLDPQQVAAAVDAIRASLRAAGEDAGLSRQQVDELVATFVDADGRVAQLGLVLDDDAFVTDLDDAIRAGQGTDGLVFEPGLDIASEAFYIELQQAQSDGNAFAGNPFVTGLGADPSEFDNELEQRRLAGFEFDGLTFEPGLGVDASDFDAGLSRAERARADFDRSRATLDLRAVDNASRTIDAVARRRQVFLDLTPTGVNNARRAFARASGTQAAEGLIIGPGQVRAFQDGGMLDGIVPATPGGVFGLANGVPVLVSENGGDELLINSRASIARSVSLIERFANGALDDQLRRHYLNQAVEGAAAFQDGGIIQRPSAAPGGSGAGNDLLQRIAVAVESQTGGGGQPATIVNNFIERVEVTGDGGSLGDELALTTQLPS